MTDNSTKVMIICILLAFVWGFFVAVVIPSWWALLPSVIGGFFIGAIGSYYVD